MQLSNLRQLVDIITKNVERIEQLAAKENIIHPTIDDLYVPEAKEEKFTTLPEVLEASMFAVSAASQLVATLKLPGMILLDRANAFHIPSALRIASETCVPEILRDAGPKGLNVKQIAAQTGSDDTVLARALRLLATHYVFKEIEPNVFANNRISSMIDTGKPTDIVLAIAKKKKENIIKEHGVSNVQGDKYVGTTGISALVDQCTDEVFKSSAFLPDTVITNDYSKTSFQRALQFDATMWEFFEKYPGYLQRIQMAMVAWGQLQPQQKNFIGFDWSSLPKDALVVDVGGGNGSEAFEIAKKAPHIKVIVQDREQTIGQVTTPTWQNDAEKKDMLNTGRVKLQAQDFFTAQPSQLDKKVTVYFLRFITHDWSTSEGIKILKHLHNAAPAQGRLIIVDQLVPYACANPDALSSIQGVDVLTPPAPLLANFGETNSNVYITDFTMAALLNAQERTLGEFKAMAEEAGWEIEKIHQTVGSSLSQILCIRRT